MTMIVILSASIIIQLFTAFLCLLSIRLTGKKFYWIAVSIAVSLMTIRRFIPMYNIITGNSHNTDLILDIIGLVLSCLLLTGIIGIRKVLTEWKAARLHNEELLREKEFLLKEVHHRIKNNIASIEAIFNIHKNNNQPSSEVQTALNEASLKLSGMRILYENILMSDNTEKTSSETYLNRLIDTIAELFTVPDTMIKIDRSIEHVEMSAKPLFTIGIIINELITNSCKYAFPSGGEGSISISLKKSGSKAVLTVSDSGPGFPPERNQKTRGFGLELVKMLVKQLRGKIMIESEGRFRCSIEFPYDG